MKRRTLSMLICATMAVSQAAGITPSIKASASTLSEVQQLIESVSADIVVDKHFSGTDGDDVDGIPTYKTVQAAVSSVSSSNDEEVKIFIKNGTYKEKLTIASPYITLIGQSSEKTILTFDDASGTIKRTEDGGDGVKTYGTSASSSITVKGSAVGFSAVNLTMENSFDEAAHPEISSKQAVALKVEADEAVFVNCRFLGNQDTLYPNKNKQYFYKCYVEGDVDFIFGAATSVFEDCELKSVDREGISPKGYVAAPSTAEETKYGFLFLDSRLTSNIDEPGSVYLGRPWHPSSAKTPVISNVVYMNCELGDHIAADGWSEMSCSGTMIQPIDNDMFEYNNYGDGAVENDNRRILSEEQAEEYSKESYLQGWDPSERVEVLSSYEENTDEEEGGDTDTDFTPGDSDTSDDNTGDNTENQDPVENAEWKFTRFGVTTSPENNTIDIDDVNNTVTITSGRSDGTNAGGKVTGSNDGLSYYYTEIDPSENFELSAIVKVNFFEKAKPDNQCAFGIIARDTLGVADDVSVSPSNMVLVGGYRAKLQSVFRNGVTPDLSDTIKMENVHTFDSTRPAPGSTYKLTLKKTNTGYIASVNDGEGYTYYRPKQLEVVDSGKIYVGFATARIASITVSDIQLTKTKVADDPEGIPEPVQKVTPALSVKSSQASASTNYDLQLEANVDGNVAVNLNGNEIYNGNITAETKLSVPSTLNGGNNTFDIVYTPAVTETNDNTTPINTTHTVNVKSYGVENGEVYVSQTGTADGDGTIENPVDIYTAIKYAGDGQTIKVKGGTYNLTSPITVEYTNNGTANKMKTLESYDGRAIFDFGKVSKGINFNGSYWHVKNIDVTKTLDANAGIRVAGSHNIMENIKTYANGDTGLQISAPAQSDPRSIWPSYNLILNCDSYDNMDSAMNNADGFAAKITCGEGNVFRGCVSHNNCDDGWDLFSKLEVGAIGAVTIENCIAYGNGTLTNGTVTKGDGNGFKLGGEGIPVQHTLLNSLSFNNDAAGITGNSNPAARVENSMSVDNDVNYSLDYYTNAVLKYVFKNNGSFHTTASENDDYIPDFVKSSTCYFYDGTKSVNIDGKELTADMFKSTEMPAAIERDEENNIIWTDYMALADKNNNNDDNTEDSGNKKHHGSHKHTSGDSDDSDKKDNVEDKNDQDQTNKDDHKEPVKEGWVEVNGHWYHMHQGNKNTGWNMINSKWYFFNLEGVMHTGWLKDNSKWYHLNASGEMSIGWLKDSNNKWYFLNASGEMKTGWHHDSDGNWYFLKSNGEMASNETIDGYYVNHSGAWVK